MGTTMIPVAFGTLLIVIWLGTPFYWGWVHLSLWGPVIWSVLVATVAVATSITVALCVLYGLCGLRPDVRVARWTMR